MTRVLAKRLAADYRKVQPRKSVRNRSIGCVRRDTVRRKPAGYGVEIGDVRRDRCCRGRYSSEGRFIRNLDHTSRSRSSWPNKDLPHFLQRRRDR